jgi:predicted permease
MLGQLRIAFRSLFKAPSFTLIAVLTLALGIGATTAIFSVVDGVLVRPLRFEDSGRIVSVTTRWKDSGRETPRLAGPDFVDVRSESRSFDAVAMYVGGEMAVRSARGAEHARVFLVSEGFFDVFRLKAAAGRLFTADEEKKGGAGAAVVSDVFAVRIFGGAAQAVGQTLEFDERPLTITGVLAPGAVYPDKAEVWIPASIIPLNQHRTAFNYYTVARLKKDIDPRAAQAELSSLAERLARQFPENRNKDLALTPLKSALTGRVRETLLLLMGAVAMVLLIACANVANLMIARGARRAREVAVHSALGATRARLLGMLGSESLLIALAGGAGGVLLAREALHALTALAPANLPRLSEAAINVRVLAFALALSAVASVLAGLAPAWRASRVDLVESLKQGGQRGLLGGATGRLKAALVIGEIALSFVLAIGAGLLFRSFLEVGAADLGYRTEKRLVMQTSVPAKDEEGHKRAVRFFDDLLPELSRLPGVESAGAAMGLPASQYGSNGMYGVQGKHQMTPEALNKLPSARFTLVSPGYFATMGVPLLQGRDFTARDSLDSEPVAVISASLARQTFARENPIGQKIICGLDRPDWMTIVGVAGDVRQDSPASPPEPHLYMPYAQHPFRANEMHVVLRTAVAPESLAAPVRELVRRRNPAAPVKFTTMEELVAASVASQRFRTVLLSAFSGLAFLLALAGSYSVMAAVTAQRTGEFALRLALGARPRQVSGMVLRGGLALGCAGIVIGAAASLAASRLFQSMLYGVRAADPLTYAAVSVLMLAAIAAAALAPARRAASTDPMTSLREE